MYKQVKTSIPVLGFFCLVIFSLFGCNADQNNELIYFKQKVAESSVKSAVEMLNESINSVEMYPTSRLEVSKSLVVENPELLAYLDGVTLTLQNSIGAESYISIDLRDPFGVKIDGEGKLPEQVKLAHNFDTRTELEGYIVGLSKMKEVTEISSFLFQPKGLLATDITVEQFTSYSCWLVYYPHLEANSENNMLKICSNRQGNIDFVEASSFLYK